MIIYKYLIFKATFFENNSSRLTSFLRSNILCSCFPLFPWINKSWIVGRRFYHHWEKIVKFAFFTVKQYILERKYYQRQTFLDIWKKERRWFFKSIAYSKRPRKFLHKFQFYSTNKIIFTQTKSTGWNRKALLFTKLQSNSSRPPWSRKLRWSHKLFSLLPQNQTWPNISAPWRAESVNITLLPTVCTVTYADIFLRQFQSHILQGSLRCWKEKTVGWRRRPSKSLPSLPAWTQRSSPASDPCPPRCWQCSRRCPRAWDECWLSGGGRWPDSCQDHPWCWYSHRYRRLQGIGESVDLCENLGKTENA